MTARMQRKERAPDRGAFYLCNTATNLGPSLQSHAASTAISPNHP
jgi:hypothetical protein